MLLRVHQINIDCFEIYNTVLDVLQNNVLGMFCGIFGNYIDLKKKYSCLVIYYAIIVNKVCSDLASNCASFTTLVIFYIYDGFHGVWKYNFKSQPFFNYSNLVTSTKLYTIVLPIRYTSTLILKCIF